MLYLNTSDHAVIFLVGRDPQKKKKERKENSLSRLIRNSSCTPSCRKKATRMDSIKTGSGFFFRIENNQVNCRNYTEYFDRVWFIIAYCNWASATSCDSDSSDRKAPRHRGEIRCPWWMPQTHLVCRMIYNQRCNSVTDRVVVYFSLQSHCDESHHGSAVWSSYLRLVPPQHPIILQVENLPIVERSLLHSCSADGSDLPCMH